VERDVAVVEPDGVADRDRLALVAEDGEVRAWVCIGANRWGVGMES
jgi:hypothetical protein